MIRRPPRSTRVRSSAASDVYKRQELARVLDEGLHVAQGHGAGGDAVTAQDGYHHVVEVGQELHRGLDDAGQELCAEAGLVEAPVLASELVDGGRPAAEDLYQSMSGCL